MKVLSLLFAISFLLLSGNGYAHKSSDSYLKINFENNKWNIVWDIAIRDLQNVINIDENADGKVTWGEVKFSRPFIESYAISKLNIVSGEDYCVLLPSDLKLNRHADGAYVVLYLIGNCSKNVSEVDVKYDLFFEVDKQHRGLLNFKTKNVDSSIVFSPTEPMTKVSLVKENWMQTFQQYFVEGVWHIWIGYDHILFLLSLLIPMVLVKQYPVMVGAEDFKSSFWVVLKVVTAFTIAHSITLSLSSLNLFSINIVIAESIIALSVALAALNNIRPIFPCDRWIIGFFFGLIHGFGFASVLAELQLSNVSLGLSLLGFNAGVEIGQILIVAVFLPIAFLVRNTWVYQRLVVQLGSFLIVLVGTFWFVERTF